MAVERQFSKTLIIGASFLFLLLSFLLLWMLFHPIDREEKFQQYYIESVNALEAQDYDTSWRNLRRLKGYAEDADDWYKILDQANRLSKEKDQWVYLRKIAVLAIKHHPEQEDFWAVYVCAHLWEGKFQKAYNEVDRLYSPKFQTIAAEVFLVNESLKIDPEIKPFDGVLTALKENLDPQYYHYIASYTQNDALKADAALLWLLQGDLEKAYTLTKDIADSRVPDQLSGYIAYDWGDFSLAQTYLLNQLMVDKAAHRERWTLNALLGDISFMMNQYDEAERYYVRSLELQPDNNWKSQLNLSLLSHIQGLDKVSLNRMEEALEKYPHSPEVIMHFIKYWKEEYPVVSRRLLNHYLAENPQNVHMKLEAMLHFPEEMSPLEYSALLWDLFNQDDSNVDISRFLVWYLLSMGDMESAEIVIDRHRSANKQEQWTGLYEGIIASLTSTESWNYAEEQFETSRVEVLFPYALYNLAVLQAKQGKGFVALETLNRAVEQFEIQGITENLSISSRFDSLYGEIYHILGNHDKAEDYARKALEKDESNSQARALLLEL